MEPPDFECPALIPHGRALRLLLQPEDTEQSPAHTHGLQVLWLCSVSGPSAPCKLLPLPSKRYLCSEEPEFPSCSLADLSSERQGSGPWERRASVPARAGEEPQGSGAAAGLGRARPVCAPAAIPAGRRL